MNSIYASPAANLICQEPPSRASCERFSSCLGCPHVLRPPPLGPDARLRGRIALAALLGILATFAGIARFVLLGTLLARVFAGAAFADLRCWSSGSRRDPAARAARPRAHADRARHGRTRPGAAARHALRQDRFARTGVVRGRPHGGVMLSMVDGVEQLQTFFGQYLPQVCVAAIAPIAILAVMVWWDAPVTLVMVAAALLTLVMPVLFHRNDRRSSTARQQAFKAFGEEFLDTIQGLPTLKAFGRARPMAASSRSRRARSPTARCGCSRPG